jgi:excisionase family DNA binding protein
MNLDDLARLLGLIPTILENQTKLLDRLDRLAAAAPTPEESAMLTVRQFAARAGLSTCTVRRHIADGTLVSTKIGGAIRIPASSLQPTSPADVSRLAREARGT